MRRSGAIPRIWLLILISLISAGTAAQTSAPDTLAKALLAQQRWDEVVRLAESSSHRTAELNYCYGMALARLQRWQEAARAFQAGASKSPGDKRFPIELAGVAFQRQQYGAAASQLRKALRLDPQDSYANDFLGTVYFLDDNLPAALKYWNRIAKPALANVTSEPQPRIDPVLLDRAFAFSPASVLRASDLQLTELRLRQLQVFPSYRFELLPKEDGSFDLRFRSSERNGWGDTKLQALVSLFRNLPFQTINPEFFNLRRSAANLVSVVRWDTKKQRVFSSFSAPLHGDPDWRYGLFIDLRKEHWELAGATGAVTAGGQNLILKKAEAGADIQSFAGARWSWRAGFSLSQRTFGGSGFDSAFAGQFLRNGIELKYSAQLNASLFSIPERRVAATTSVAVQRARLWDTRNSSFTKTTAALNLSWLPVARGDDYHTSAQLRWGQTIGQVPFDELFVLGMERDNDLWMRAHPATRNGMKGSAPMGRDYLLFNWELDKKIRNSALFNVSLGPLLDTGGFLDESDVLGSRRWLCDVGVQAKVRIIGGVGIVLSYAKDLRRGRNVFYVTGLP